MEWPNASKRHPAKMSTSDAGGKSGSESPKRRGLFLTLLRAWRVRNDEELSAEDAASTLFRFFRSKHVGDLRLIELLARWLLLPYLLVALLIALIPPPNTAQSTSQNTSQNTPPIIIQFLIFYKTFAQYFGPAVPIYGAIVAWVYISASKRLGIIDLFACEISTLCRVGTIFDIGKIYVDMYDQGNAAEKHAKAKHIASSQSFDSQEDYFPIFDHNSSDLESLEALVVESITEYYTYMKAARDLLRKLASIDVSHISKSGDSATVGTAKVDPWHQTVADVIYVLYLGYESARKAITDLTEFQPTQAEHTIVILLTELVCYSFLCKFHKHNSVRFARLRLRQSDYERIVPALIQEVSSGYEGNQRKYWAPAQGAILELELRFHDAMTTLLRCTKS
jgi:hypothetical protein